MALFWKFNCCYNYKWVFQITQRSFNQNWKCRTLRFSSRHLSLYSYQNEPLEHFVSAPAYYLCSISLIYFWIPCISYIFLSRKYMVPSSCTWHISMWNMHLWYSLAVIDHIAVHTHALIPNHIFMAPASKLSLLGKETAFSLTQCFLVLRITICCIQVASCRSLVYIIWS